MRKVLGLLVAAVFVASVASVASAQITSSNTFRAEISFASTNTAFGFALFEMPSTATKPASTDGPASMIHWSTSFTQMEPEGFKESSTTVRPAQTAYAQSRVYAKITTNATDSLDPSISVLIYTDNKNGTTGANGYIFHSSYTGAQTKNAMPLAAMLKSTPSENIGLPLTYKIIQTDMPEIVVTTYTAKVNYAGITSIGELDMADGPYGVMFLLDKQNPDANTRENILLAKYDGLRTGTGDPLASDAGPHYRWAGAGADTYMFFATSAYNANRGHRYGTDKLTVELITE